MRTNHLIGEKSPYLLQHAHNPVDWYPWGKVALDKAKLEDKPILLSVGYSTCHWCHVMAHESFEDQGISKIINDHFIAIKVDREERPDIDHIYMMATTSMTGQGGWPLTVFLTPQGDPFYGGTYFPPYAKWGSLGFIDLLNSISAGWKTDRENILSSSHSITESLRERAKADSGVMDETFLDRAFRQLRGQFDAANGGFGSAPKFPMGHNLSFLLRFFKHFDQPEALDMVKNTLTAMGRGGIWDHLGGGFHRYSTDQNWHVPHFEKMLYDQALLSRAYLEGFQATGSVEFAQVARAILDYVAQEMTDALGGFYSAQDADSLETKGGELKEGAFYVFSQSEIIDALGSSDAEVFNYCYGVLSQGNAAFDPHGEFKGKNILYQAHSIDEAAAEFHRQSNEIQGILTVGKSKLLALRDQRPHPHKDNKVLCDWNGLMIASFAFASRVLGEPKYAVVASKAADFILTQMMDKKRLLHRWREGAVGIAATLEDYAFFIYGLLEVYEATFQEKYLDEAKHLADGMIELFADDAGGFYMTASDAEALIIRPKEVYDGALPSGNSVAALSLLKLHALTKNDIYLSRAEALFGCFAPSVSSVSYAHCFLLSALDWHLQGPLEITFQGAEDDPTIAKMLKVLYKHFMPYKAVKLIPASISQVQICHRGTCGLPVDSVGTFENDLFSEAFLMVQLFFFGLFIMALLAGLYSHYENSTNPLKYMMDSSGYTDLQTTNRKKTEAVNMTTTNGVLQIRKQMDDLGVVQRNFLASLQDQQRILKNASQGVSELVMKAKQGGADSKDILQIETLATQMQDEQHLLVAHGQSLVALNDQLMSDRLWIADEIDYSSIYTEAALRALRDRNRLIKAQSARFFDHMYAYKQEFRDAMDRMREKMEELANAAYEDKMLEKMIKGQMGHILSKEHGDMARLAESEEKCKEQMKEEEQKLAEANQRLKDQQQHSEDQIKDEIQKQKDQQEMIQQRIADQRQLIQDRQDR